MFQVQKNYKKFDINKPIAIIGAGVMGTKVAWASARSGIETRLYDIEYGKAKLSRDLVSTWSQGKESERVKEMLKTPDTIEKTLAGVQLVHENIPEKLFNKIKLIKNISDSLSPEVFIGSNTSALRCSQLASASDRPDKFFNLNFSDPRYSKLVELMVSDQAAPETILFAHSWSQAIGMVVVETKKEQNGYIMNRIWRVIKKEALRQIEEGYASPQDIDRAWMLAFGTKIGPCGLMDDIGLHSVLAIEEVYYNQTKDPSDKPTKSLLKLVKEGNIGSAVGSGFYSYPDPEYADSEFIKPNDQIK